MLVPRLGRILRAVAIAAPLTIVGFPAHADFHLQPPAEGEELFAYTKADRGFIRMQMGIVTSHLKSAIAHLEGSPDSPAIHGSAHSAHLAYRLMRYARASISLLDVNKSARLANPIHALVIETITKSQGAILEAGLRLNSADKWPENRQENLHEAVEQLNRALFLVEEVNLLF
jgi:hypothetical protein